MFELGKKQVLTVVKTVDFGVYLSDGTDKDNTERVLLPIKQVPEGTKMGDQIEVFIYKDSQDRPIATTNAPKLMLGETARLRVVSVGKMGAFLDWGLEKDLFLPKSFRESNVYLRFGGVTGKSTVWVNGKQVTYHREGGTLPFECEISSALHSGENRIVVLSDNSLDQWSLPPAAVVTPEYNDALLGAYPGVTYDFFPYSGIQRSVYLYTCAENRIEDITINTRLDADVAIIDYAIKVSPETNGQILVEVEAQNAIHTLSASAHTIRGSMRVANPRIWDVGVPNMYDMRVALQKNGKEIDEYIQPFGIRTIEVKGNALLLNGKPVYLRGCAKHEDFMVLGI